MGEPRKREFDVNSDGPSEPLGHVFNAKEHGRGRTLGQELRALRHAARLSLRQLEWLCELSAPQLCRIESGARRTRQSTLERIAAALVSVRPDLGPAAELARWHVPRRAGTGPGVCLCGGDR